MSQARASALASRAPRPRVASTGTLRRGRPPARGNRPGPASSDPGDRPEADTPREPSVVWSVWIWCSRASCAAPTRAASSKTRGIHVGECTLPRGRVSAQAGRFEWRFDPPPVPHAADETARPLTPRITRGDRPRPEPGYAASVRCTTGRAKSLPHNVRCVPGSARTGKRAPVLRRPRRRASPRAA